MAGATITRDSKFREVAALWLVELEKDADRNFRLWGTVDTYRNRLEFVVLPALGDLRLREVSVPIVDRL